MKKLIAICLLLLLASCTSPPQSPQSPQPQSPELTWDHDPATLIIRVAFSGGGSAPNAALVNELFGAQVWGDGRIIWITWDKDYHRQVWQGQLSEAQMTSLLETFADKGFFDMDARYEPDEDILDGGATSLSVHLLSTSTQVSEYLNSAPDEFHELTALLSSGAGVEGTPYMPPSGQLTAREITPRDGMDSPELPIWDATALELDLHDAERIWVEGDALARAWEAVNRNSAFPIMVQGDSYFELYLRLPELSVMEPH